MIPFEYDDGGRAASGRKGDAGDCVCRAIAITSGRPYDEVYRLLAKEMKDAGHARSARNGILKSISRRLLPELGYRKVPQGRGKRMTLTQVADRYGTAIISTTRHLAAIKDGVLRDTSDIRTYLWVDRYQDHDLPEVHQRKAASIWVNEGAAA